MRRYPMVIDSVARTVYLEAAIESSSDFIVTAYEMFKRTNKDMMITIDPVYKWEYANWHDSWESNVNFISKRLQNLDPEDYNDVYDCYTNILKYFVDDDIVSKIYKMDDKDKIGWKIFKELNEKRALCLKFLAISIKA